MARERRRRWDADYREQVRRSKFCTKFGHRAFLDYYFPLYSTHGPHLPGLKFVWNDDEARARKSHKAKPRRTKVKVVEIERATQVEG
ncbi:hypothetical protein B0H14DRAFT_3455733 [Mycena olivaceomarginata]|nr:hypothetical protein B0H14DRAFT_3455733 [Mycena olivaceomarginata]